MGVVFKCYSNLMDYFIGFLFGYFFKEVWHYLNELSDIRAEEQIIWEYDEDDLP